MPSTPKRGRSLASTLQGLLDGHQGERLKLGDFVTGVEEDEGPGPVLFILTLPVLLPSPPGVSMVLALMGVAATALALLLVLPLPAANLAPSLALALLALGLSRRDGLLVLAGYGMLALAAGVIWLAVAGFRFGLGYLKP